MDAEPGGSPAVEPRGGAAAAHRGTEQRPTGVSVLAILSFLGAAVFVMGALAAFVAGGLVADVVGGGPGSLFVGAGAAFLGVGALFLAAINALMGWGLWTGQGWAWLLTIAFEGLWALGSVLGLLDGDVGSLVPLAIAAAILWYLFRPWVRRFFDNPV